MPFLSAFAFCLLGIAFFETVFKTKFTEKTLTHQLLDLLLIGDNPRHP